MYALFSRTIRSRSQSLLIFHWEKQYLETSRNNSDKGRAMDSGTSRDKKEQDEENEFFTGRRDNYDGITVDSSLESCKPNNFVQCLRESLKRWKSDNRRTIWFRVNIANAEWIPALANEGFDFHHAQEGYATMYKWLPTNSANNIPPYAHTNLGVGGFVLNDDTGEVLLVKDRRSVLGGAPRWKLPGGCVDRGEYIPEAVIREVREETGIITEFESIIGFRHAHGYNFGCSDIYVVAKLKPLTRDIKKCELEIADCTWMRLEEYANDPEIVENNRILANAMIQYRKDRVSLKQIIGEHPLTKKPVSIYLFTPPNS